MSDVPRYSLEDDLEEQAEAASRDLRQLPDQLAKLRQQLDEVKRRLAAAAATEERETQRPPSND